MSRPLLSAAALVLLSWPTWSAAACLQTSADKAAIRAVIDRYRDRWLAGDRAGVMATFTAEPTLLPPAGAAPLVGAKAVEAFWWPPGPATTVTRLDITVEDVGGDCQVAYARGVDTVGWATEGSAQVRGNSGTYLNVLMKGPDGAWRISHHMWDDDPRQRR